MEGHVDIVRLLLEAGADPNAHDADGTPLLIEATWRRHVEVVQLLVDAGADPNAPAPNGDTALSEATWRGYPRLSRYYWGARPQVPISKSTM